MRDSRTDRGPACTAQAWSSSGPGSAEPGLRRRPETPRTTLLTTSPSWLDTSVRPPCSCFLRLRPSPSAAPCRGSRHGRDSRLGCRPVPLQAGYASTISQGAAPDATLLALTFVAGVALVFVVPAFALLLYL